MKNLMYAMAIAIMPLNILAQEREQTDKHFWNTLSTTAAPEEIWRIWTDVSRWKEWDSGLQDAYLKDPFQLSARGTITSLEGRKSKFEVVQIEKGKSYTIKTKLPFGALFVKRHMETKEGVVHFTHEVWFTGLTSGIFAKRFGPKFRRLLPEVMDNVKRFAEQ